MNAKDTSLYAREREFSQSNIEDTFVRTNVRRLALGLCLVGLTLPAFGGNDGDFSKTIVESAPAAEDAWEFSLTANGWGPWVEITSTGGQEIDIGLDDIVDSLQGVLELGVGIRKGKWSLFTDVIWVDLEADNLGPIDNFELKEWLVTPKIGYRAFEGDWGYVDLQVGGRYTYVDVEIEGDGFLGFDEEGSADIWDLLAGFTGHYNINEKWYVPFMVEAGAGDSDFVAAAFVGGGYHFEEVDVYFGFKYLYYDFGDSAPMDDETGYGPMLSVKYTF